MNNRINYTLIFLLFITAVFDIYTTIINKNFLALETNIVFLGIGAVGVVIVGKFIVVALFSYFLISKSWNTRITFHFFVIYLVIALSILQVIAGVGNISIKEKIVNEVNFNTQSNYTVSTIPSESISVYVKPKSEASLYYLNFVFVNLLLPLIIALSSFLIHRKFHNDDYKTKYYSKEKVNKLLDSLIAFRTKYALGNAELGFISDLNKLKTKIGDEK
jgi:hypothetical protein